MMAHHHGALRAALGVVVAGPIFGSCKGRAIRLRAGQDVMHVGIIAPAVDWIALLGQRRLLVQVVVGAMKVRNILGDHDAFRILPGSASDAVTRVYGSSSADRLCRKIGPPRLAT